MSRRAALRLSQMAVSVKLFLLLLDMAIDSLLPYKRLYFILARCDLLFARTACSTDKDELYPWQNSKQTGRFVR
jgi:hypothetical protein